MAEKGFSGLYVRGWKAPPKTMIMLDGLYRVYNVGTTMLGILLHYSMLDAIR